MITLPDFFWADKLTLVKYYGYPSSVAEKFVEFNASDEEERSNVERFHDFKRKCMATYVDVRMETTQDHNWSMDIWDNKIVIECKTEMDNTIFIGFDGFTYSIGLDVDSPRAVKWDYKT